MKFVIIDIDNTICKKYLDRAFDELDKVHLDTPITPVVRVLEALCNHDDVFPIFITARLESSRKVTVKWLRENTELMYTYDLESNLYMKPEIPPSDLKILNELGMTLRDSMVKRYLLKKFLEKSWITKEAILGVFDGNQECNKMWREEGLFVFDVNQCIAKHYYLCS